MRIGLCGGTFDPFHRGHLEPVLAIRESMEWDAILFIPANHQPFKLDKAVSSGYHRHAMAVLATEDIAGASVSLLELERAAVSYTVDTLEMLRAQMPDASFDWIIGDDNLAALGAWRNLDRIFQLANFVVLSRGGGELPPALMTADGLPSLPVFSDPQQRKQHGSVVFTHNPAVPISATEIRERVRTGQTIDAFVDPRVSRYIQRNRLYREAHK
jgi:nicotinate-nucleotide adenylyltransferase